MEEHEKLTRQLSCRKKSHEPRNLVSQFRGAIQLAWTDGSFIGYNY